MATQWISPTWRMPKNSNQSKVDNYSLDFGGVTNQRISVSASNDIIPTNAKMSISAWIYMDTSAVGVGRTIFSNGKDNSGAKEYMFEIDTNDNLLFTVRTLAASPYYATITGSTTISLNTWHHVAITWDGANLNLYLNGASDASPVAATSFYTSGTNDAPFIGVRRGGAGSYFSPWAGKLGQICYYNTGLSAPQVDALWNSGTPVNPMALSPLPIAYYPLGGSSTGSASTLTTPNDAVPSATVFNFDDAASQFVVLPQNANTIPNATGYTFSGWFNPSDLSGATTYRTLYSTDAGTGVTIWLYSSGFYVYQRYNGAWIKLQMSALTADLAVGKWFHFAVSWDGSDKIKAYINGIFKQEQTGAGGIDNPSPPYAGSYPALGDYSGYTFDGQISNFQIYDTNLTDGSVSVGNPATGQIAELYNNGVPPSTAVASSNLKAWYKLNVDTSTWDGSDWIIGEAQANYSSALNFDGVDDVIPIRTMASMSGVLDDFTYSCWMRTSVAGVYGQYEVTFGGYSNGGAGFDPGKLWTPYGTTDLTFPVAGATKLNDGVWHHVATTFNDSTKAVNYYLDGQLDASTTWPGYITHFAITIGAGNAASTYNFTGNISNCVLHDSELTQAQIETLYNNGTPQLSPSFSPYGWWKCDNLTTGIQDSAGSNNGTNNGGTTAIDIEVSNLNGLSSGMTTANLVTSDLTRSIPYSSYSLNFEGSGDAIALSSGVSTGNNYSVSFWLNPDDVAAGNSYIFSDSTGTPWPGLALDQGSSTAGGPGNFYYYNGTVVVPNTTAIPLGSWSHIVITLDVTGQEIKFYINGILDKTTTSVANIGTLIDEFGTRNAGNYFEGKLSNISIFTTPLSQDQILTIYNGGVPNDISSLSPTGWWSLAGDSYYDGTNWICPDLSSGSNNGTSVNMAATELIGNGPGSTANGTASGYMNFIDDLKGDAPSSTSNAFSINMTETDRVSGAGNVPG